ncbi:hypothetical protein PtrM4_058560 [Pyrenophora tritici-repentis]|uniref:Vacuolar-sorting protein SNF7 n=1 Tax=Pyrenophora tritici-repentis TaxID=45151 RepID=A0A834S283_9PLEO|nr:hypothetical protein PtrM4_058560 [Pyrenophora tritici-repentis]
MSGWGLGWFGGGQAKKEAPKKAILQLRGQLEMLTKREKHLQNQMDEQDALARKHVSSNKQAAKAALRRKKQFEHSLEQTSAQIMTLEKEIHSIETANINKETLDAMKNAGKAMQQIHAGLTIDKVDTVMYVTPHPPPNTILYLKQANKLTLPAGKTSANNMPSARKSAKPSPQA